VNAVVVPTEVIGPLSPAWRECVGTGRFTLALRDEPPPWLDDSRIPGCEAP